MEELFCYNALVLGVLTAAVLFLLTPYVETILTFWIVLAVIALAGAGIGALFPRTAQFFASIVDLFSPFFD